MWGLRYTAPVIPNVAKSLNNLAKKKVVASRRFRGDTCIMVQANKYSLVIPKKASLRHRAIDAHLNPAFFKALSDPTRVLLLSCLAKCARSCSVSEVAECCAVDLSVVSRHLAQLQKAGLVAAKKSGRMVSYSVRYAEFAAALRQLADAIEECCPTTAVGKKKRGGGER